MPSKKQVTEPAVIGVALPVPGLGDQPSPQEVSYYQGFSQVLARAQLPSNRNPFWNDDIELNIARSLSYIQPITPIQGALNDRIAHRFPLADLNKPRDSVAVLQTAIRYAYENPFVAKAAKIKSDFTTLGMTLRTHNSKVMEFYLDEVDRLNMKILLRHIVWHLYAIGICPIWWGGEEDRRITNIEILDPRMCHVEYNFGRARLYLKIDEKMRQAVADPEGRVDIRNRARFQAMPKYWVRQIQEQKNIGDGKGFIELQEGSYTVVENRYTALNRIVGELDGLPIQPAFDALQRYRLLQAGDFAVAWNLKNMITLISEGDPKAEGGSWKPVSTARLSALQSQFQRPDSSFVVYCDPTTKVEYVIPPIEAFDTAKYQQPEKEIKEVLNIPSFMWISEGAGTYANAINEIKGMRLEIMGIREILDEQFFKPFFRRLRAQVARPGFKESDIVYPTYSYTSLQDDATYLKNVSDLYGRGAVSLQTLQLANDLDPEYEMEQKQIEFDKWGPTKDEAILNDTIARPLFEANQGNMQVQDKLGGAPESSTGTAQTPSRSRDKTRTPRKDGTK